MGDSRILRQSHFVAIRVFAIELTGFVYGGRESRGHLKVCHRVPRLLLLSAVPLDPGSALPACQYGVDLAR